jgi:hypothetical protein
MRHAGAVNEYWEHENLALDGRSQLVRHPVTVVVKALAALVVGACEPLTSDDDHQRGGTRQSASDFIWKIGAVRNTALDVHEDAGLPEFTYQPVVQTAGGGGTVDASVTDEYQGHSKKRTAIVSRRLKAGQED